MYPKKVLNYLADLCTRSVVASAYAMNSQSSELTYLENGRYQWFGADGAVEQLHPHGDLLPLWNALSLLVSISFPLYCAACSLHRWLKDLELATPNAHMCVYIDVAVEAGESLLVSDPRRRAHVCGAINCEYSTEEEENGLVSYGSEMKNED
jgi:hypothetical protein